MRKRRGGGREIYAIIGIQRYLLRHSLGKQQLNRAAAHSKLARSPPQEQPFKIIIMAMLWGKRKRRTQKSRRNG